MSAQVPLEKRLGSAPILEWRVRLSHADDLKLSSLHSRAVFHVSGPKPIILYRAMDPLAATGLCDFIQRWSCVPLLLGVVWPLRQCVSMAVPGLHCGCWRGVCGLLMLLLSSYSASTSGMRASSLWSSSIPFTELLVPLAVSRFFECNECAAAMRPLHSGCVWLVLWACCAHAIFGVWCGRSDCNAFSWLCLASIVAAGVVCVVSSCSYSHVTWHQHRGCELKSLGDFYFFTETLVPLAVSCFFECNECAAAMRPLHSGCVWLLLWAYCDHAVFQALS